MSVEEKIEDRHATARLRYLILFGIIFAIILIAIYSVSKNTLEISFTQAYTIIYKALFGIPYDNYMENLRARVIFELNMPRTLAAILVGCSLAVGGAMMQSITRNPLTDSYTIGISSAAMLGVTIGVVYGICIIPFVSGDLAIIINAFLFALIPSAAIVLVSSFKKMSATMMILIGIGIMYVFSAFSTFIKFNTSAENLQVIYEKGVGTLSYVTWDCVIPLVIGTAVIITVGMIFANGINVMCSGDNMARALGVRPVLLRVICFVVISISTGICVAYTGTIGFVGLVAPHIARLFVGSDNKILIPTSAILGALLILGADTAVRMIGGLPVGTITAVIGSPIFLFILYKQRKKAAF